MRSLTPVQAGLERYALMLTRDADDAKDLVSETILIAFEQFERLQSTESFLPYLITIARRIHFKGYKKSDTPAISGEPSTSANELLADVSFILEAIDQLPALQREAIILFELAGLSIKEIAQTQSSSVIATKVRLTRARQFVRKRLGIRPKVTPSSTIDTDNTAAVII